MWTQLGWFPVRCRNNVPPCAGRRHLYPSRLQQVAACSGRSCTEGPWAWREAQDWWAIPCTMAHDGACTCSTCANLCQKVGLQGRSIFRPLSQTHISKRELKNGHISRFCSVFQVIQVISLAKVFSAEEVDLSFNSETKEHPQISNPSFWKRDHENVFLQMF